MIAEDQDAGHDQHGHHRPADEEFGDVHDAPAPRPTRDLGAGGEPQLADGDDLLAGREAAGDDGVVALGARDLDVAQLDGQVRLDDVDVLAGRAALHRADGATMASFCS